MSPRTRPPRIRTSEPELGLVLDLHTGNLDTGPGLLDSWVWTSGCEGLLAYMNYNDNMCQHCRCNDLALLLDPAVVRYCSP